MPGGRSKGRPFRPGISGNPGGRTKGLEKLVREIVGDDITAIVKAQVAIAQGKKPAGCGELPAIKASDMSKAAEWIGDRGWGKARQTVDLGTDVNLDTLDLTKMTDEQLDDLITKATTAAEESHDSVPARRAKSPPR